MKTSYWGRYQDPNSILWSQRFIIKYLNFPAPHRRYRFVFMIFTLRSRDEKLKIQFDLSGLGAEKLALPRFLCNLAQANAFRRDFQSRLLLNLPYGVTGLRLQRFSWLFAWFRNYLCSPGFSPNMEHVFGRNWHLREKSKVCYLGCSDGSQYFWKIAWLMKNLTSVDSFC